MAPENVAAKGISILCSVCQQTIYAHHFFNHKKTHKALTLLGYGSSQTKVDNDTLLAQRQKLISKVTKLPKNSERHRQKINISFEFLMGDRSSTSYCDPDNTNSVNALKKVKNSSIKALSVCQDKNSMWRRDMEDRFFVVDNYGRRSDTCFLGLIDGHHGTAAAETVAAELPLLFLDQLAQTDPSYRTTKEEQQILDSFATVITEDYREKERIFSDRQESKTNKTNTYEWIHKAYAKSFWRMDRLLQLGRNEVSRVRWSGCSAVTCLMERLPSENMEGTEERKHFENSMQSSLTTTEDVTGLLHIANIGNVHAVLCKNGKSYCLSEEHSTSNVREKKRILQNGGNISTNEPDGLVEGHLRTTRGLGYHGDPTLKRSVIPVPHTISVPIDDSCQFLILASNGLWEILDYNEVCALTLTTFTRYLRMYERIQPNGASLCNCQYLMPHSEEESNASNTTDYQQDGTEILDSNTEIFLTDSKGNLTYSKISCNKPVSYTGQQPLKTTLPADCEPPTHFEEDTKTYLSSCESQTAGKGGVTSEALYDNAASYISEQLVKAALDAGSRDNITILIVLLNGCDKL
ncbi:PP2D1 protein, partial [Odontophorus gujanensis]|nr:PP2D1 protein [Odontophorus gujanensis]